MNKRKLIGALMVALPLAMVFVVTIIDCGLINIFKVFAPIFGFAACVGIGIYLFQTSSYDKD